MASNTGTDCLGGVSAACQPSAVLRLLQVSVALAITDRLLALRLQVDTAA